MSHTQQDEEVSHFTNGMAMVLIGSVLRIKLIHAQSDIMFFNCSVYGK